MNETNRRAFLRRMGAASVTTAVGTSGAMARSANDRVVLGVIGTGGMGTNHVRTLARRDDVELAWVCDVDEQRVGKAAEAAGSKPNRTGDLRKVLDDPRVDAVLIATPDHWHAPATLLALDAGKHVYVEKPCCHNVREGRMMAEAVARTGLVLQVGTQSRSTEFVRDAIDRLHDGAIGEVLVAKAWNSQKRGSIGRSKPSDPPAELDFDTWLGPAPVVPYRSNLLHAVWRWWHDFGCGDIGNDGVHDIDVALWGLGVETHPERVACLGGKFFFDDDQQFPDTQYAVCEYAPGPDGRRRQLIFEQRDWSPYVQEGYENGAAFYGTEGLLVMGHTKGWKLYGPRNKLIEERTGSGDYVAHHANFLNAIRGGESPNASIADGHRGATIVHLANIAARIDRVVRFDPESERAIGDGTAHGLLGRKYREHWATPQV